MVIIKRIDNTSNKGSTYVEMATEKREVMVSYSPAYFYPIAVYTTKRLTTGRTFKTWEEALKGFKNKNILAMIETAREAVA